MGLDVYVGALSRYYSGNWETIIQQNSYELGMEVQIIRANASQFAPINQDKIRAVTLNPDIYHGNSQRTPAYRASLDKAFKSNFDQLLRGTELWLPCDFAFTFSATDVTGNNITIGSAKALLSQLENLNASTWNANESTLDAWLQLAAVRGATLETHARFAYSMFYELARLAVAHNLPMKLDY